MQERKIIIQEMADVFIVLPGSLGTLEEALDTWNAIKIGVLINGIGYFKYKLLSQNQNTIDLINNTIYETEWKRHKKS